MGDPILKVGSTGASTGAHLHFEVRLNTNNKTVWSGSSVDPMSYFEKTIIDLKDSNQKTQPSPTPVSPNAYSNCVQYYQNDYYNVKYGSGSIATCGCGPTCFAMIASTYTGRTITPKDAIAWCGNKYYTKRSRN